MKISRAVRVNNKEQFLKVNQVKKYTLENANVDYSKNPCIYLGIYNGWDYRKNINKEQFKVESFDNYINNI